MTSVSLVMALQEEPGPVAARAKLEEPAPMAAWAKRGRRYTAERGLCHRKWRV